MTHKSDSQTPLAKDAGQGSAFDRQALFDLNGSIPPHRAVPYGLQHILAMFVANLAPIYIVAAAAGLDQPMTTVLIQNALLIAGIGTLIQLFPLWRVGSGLPIVMGISFTFVSVLCGIVATYGYGAAIGAVIVGGVVEGVLGLFASYWRKLISPIVAAVVVTSIGFSLLGVGAASFGGGAGAPDFGSAQNLLLGTVSLISCLAFQVIAKGFAKQLSVLFGLVIGYVLALFMGVVDLSGFANMAIFSLPALMPVMPEFQVGAIVPLVLIFLVSATETIGDTSALTVVGLNREVRDKELSGSIACDGFTSTLSGLFGCLPITSFSQNVGLVAMTKVVNRRAIASGAVIMIAAAFIPVISVAFSSLPEAVLGGCTIMMFGNIIVSGFQMIARAGFTQRNIIIAALSLAVGLGFTQAGDLFAIFPTIVQDVFAQNCVATVFLVALVANLVLPKDKQVLLDEQRDGSHIPRTPTAEEVAEARETLKAAGVIFSDESVNAAAQAIAHQDDLRAAQATLAGEEAVHGVEDWVGEDATSTDDSGEKDTGDR